MLEWNVAYVEMLECDRQRRINLLQELARSEALHMIDRGLVDIENFLMAGAFERDLNVSWQPLTGRMWIT